MLLLPSRCATVLRRLRLLLRADAGCAIPALERTPTIAARAAPPGLAARRRWCSHSPCHCWCGVRRDDPGIEFTVETGVDDHFHQRGDASTKRFSGPQHTRGASAPRLRRRRNDRGHARARVGGPAAAAARPVNPAPRRAAVAARSTRRRRPVRQWPAPRGAAARAPDSCRVT
jgi:hypothetical protein